MTTVEYWTTSAQDAMSTADVLFEAKKYHHALFFVHLAIEKIIKALYVSKINEPAPPMHNLYVLAQKLSLPIDDTLKEQLLEITTFNVSARYDNEKYKFYKKATKEYSTTWIQIGKTIMNMLSSRI